MNKKTSHLQTQLPRFENNIIRCSRKPLVQAIALSIGLFAGSSQAATINVNDHLDISADDGVCTLREAFVTANTQVPSGVMLGECETGTGIDTIDLSLIGNQTVTLTQGQIEVATGTDITLQGGGTTISGDDSNRIFDVQPGSELDINIINLANGATKGNGGAIQVKEAILTVSSSTIKNSSSNYSGGGIYAFDSSVTIQSTTMSGNYAGTEFGDGGAVRVDNGTLGIANSNFNNNEAQYRGGAVFTNATDTTLTTVTAYLNSAFNAGAVWISNTPSANISNSNLYRNSANGDGGGGVDILQSTVTIDNTTISGNSAVKNGGGLRALSHSKVTITGGKVQDNSSDENGGGLSSSSSELDLFEVTISTNTANINGGGIYSGSSILLVDDSTIDTNYAAIDGGALAQSAGTATFENSTISGNTAAGGGYGGGIHMSDSAELNLAHATLFENSAKFGNSIGGKEFTANLTNSILFSGSTDCYYSGLPAVVNSFGGNLVGSKGNCTISDTNLISDDPDLLPLADNGNGAGTTWTHRPNPASPVFDAGDSSLVPQPTMWDQRGAPSGRIAGMATDLGAFELQGGLIKIDQSFFEVNEDVGIVEITLTRIHKSEGAIFATLNTVDDEAVAPGDYVPIVAGKVHWADGELGEQVVQIKIEDDPDEEGVEDLTLEITAPTGGAGLAGGVDKITATVRINDNDEFVEGVFKDSFEDP